MDYIIYTLAVIGSIYLLNLIKGIYPTVKYNIQLIYLFKFKKPRYKEDEIVVYDNTEYIILKMGYSSNPPVYAYNIELKNPSDSDEHDPNVTVSESDLEPSKARKREEIIDDLLS